MPDLVDAIYAAMQADPALTGRTHRDRPPGAANLPYAVVRGDLEHQRNLDLDGRTKRVQRRIDVVADDGQSSEAIEALAEACATVFDARNHDPPSLTITGYDVLAVSSDGPTDLPPDAETYGRSVLVTLWLEKEE